jgi:hypothetical protein
MYYKWGRLIEDRAGLEPLDVDFTITELVMRIEDLEAKLSKSNKAVRLLARARIKELEIILLQYKSGDFK